jgi:O-antigen ligase
MSHHVSAAVDEGSFSGRANLALNYLAVALALVLPLSRFCVTVAAALVMLLWFVEGRYRDKARVLAGSIPILALLAFILLNAVSLLWSQHLDQGAHYLGKYRYLLLVPMLATSLRPRFVRHVLTAFLCGITASLVWSYGIVLGFVHYGFGYPEHPAPSMLHLDYSMFLAVAGLLVLIRVLRPEVTLGRRLLCIALLVFIVGGLLFNIGRSGQLAFFASLLIVLPAHMPGRITWRALVSLLLALLVVLAAYAAVPTFRVRVKQAVAELGQGLFEASYDSNQGGRIAAAIIASDIISRHPLLGTGIGDNMPEFRLLLETRYPEMKEGVSDYRHFHNQYLQVATELGAVGVIALLGLFMALGSAPIANNELRNLKIALCSAYLFGFLGDPFLHKQLPLVLFALLMGVVLSQANSLWRQDAGETSC